MTPISKTDFALDVARRGFKIFPFKPNTNGPLIPNWREVATTDFGQIRECWALCPDANIGISTENLLTLRITERCPQATVAQLALLFQEHGVPKSVRTQRAISDAGIEIYLHFSLPAGAVVDAKSDVFFTGIDLLSNDDFVVGPGSLLDGEMCAFLDDKSLSQASPWLLEVCGVQQIDDEEQSTLAATAVKTVAPSVVAEKIAAPKAAAPKVAASKSAPKATPPAAGQKEAAARDAAARCFDVFPIRPYVHPGENATPEQFIAAAKAAKAPLVANWQNLATQDLRQIDAWWDEWPDANIAMATERFIVVDIDPRNGGKDTFDLLTMIHDFPETLTSNTQSGGQHWFYVLPQGVRVKGGTHKLGKGVDIKSRGGYVLLPGSTIEGRAYTWANGRPIAFAPQWLIDICNAAKPKTDAAGKRIVEEDDEARESFERWIREHAPRAELGEIDDTTYKVAARGYDYGCGLETVIELVMEWNETHCNGLGDADRLIEVCESAGRNRENAIGSKHRDAPGFKAQEIDESKAPPVAGVPTTNPAAFTAAEKAPPIKAVSLAPFDADVIPAHRWVLPGFACRGLVNTLVGPGGVSKSTLLLMMAVATVAGRDDICGFTIAEPGPVWIWNNEDDLQEMQRRIASIMRAFNVSWDDMRGEDGEIRLYVTSGVDRPLILATRKGDWGVVEGTPQVDEIIAEVKAKGIVAFIADPLVEFHEADENNNVHMKAVLGQFRRIAHLGDCAAIVAAHTRKPPQASSDGFAGDMDAMRGGGSQVASVRVGATLFSMSAKDAKDAKGYVLPAGTDHHDFVRLDIGKINIGLKPKEPKWYRRDGVKVGSPGKDGNIESVGILRCVTLEKKAQTSTTKGAVHLPSILAEILVTKWSREKHFKVADVLASATPAQQALFGNVNHRSRCITAAFDGSNESSTEFGRVSYLAAQGKPMTVYLGRSPVMRSLSETSAETDDEATARGDAFA